VKDAGLGERGWQGAVATSSAVRRLLTHSALEPAGTGHEPRTAIAAQAEAAEALVEGSYRQLHRVRPSRRCLLGMPRWAEVEVPGSVQAGDPGLGHGRREVRIGVTS
jgi:hypothetical protein